MDNLASLIYTINKDTGYIPPTNVESLTNILESLLGLDSNQVITIYIPPENIEKVSYIVNLILDCSRGNIKRAQETYNSYEKLDILNCIFNLACYTKHENIIYFLLEQEIKKITNNESILIESYMKNARLVAQFLFSDRINLFRLNKPLSKKILTNIFQLNEKEGKLFNAAIIGNTEVIKNLIQQGVDYSFLDNFVFYRSCINNNIEIAEFFSKLSAKYYYEIEPESSKIIDYNIIIPKNSRNI